MSAHSDPRLPETALRRWRRASGMSFAELARRIGRSTRTVLRLAAGGAPSAATAQAIRRATGVDLNELVGEALPPEPRATRQEPATTPATPRQGSLPFETPAGRTVALSRPGNERRGPRKGVVL